MHETGCSGLVYWDDPEGWDGEGGGRAHMSIIQRRAEINVQTKKRAKT